jgi:hypothetical protein
MNAPVPARSPDAVMAVRHRPSGRPALHCRCCALGIVARLSRFTANRRGRASRGWRLAHRGPPSTRLVLRRRRPATHDHFTTNTASVDACLRRAITRKIPASLQRIRLFPASGSTLSADAVTAGAASTRRGETRGSLPVTLGPCKPLSSALQATQCGGARPYVIRNETFSRG